MTTLAEHLYPTSTPATSIRPLSDHVLIKRDAAGEKSPGGIIVPENAKEKPARGKVVAVGPGRVDSTTGRRIEPAVKRDDVVLFGRYAGTELARDYPDHLLVREDDILAVVGTES